MSAIRFLLDENVDPLYRSELLRHEPSLTVWRVGDISAPSAIRRLTPTNVCGACSA